MSPRNATLFPPVNEISLEAELDIMTSESNYLRGEKEVRKISTLS